VKLIASWYTYLILTKTQIQTLRGWTICCNEEKKHSSILQCTQFIKT